jgi:hypothetical protein
MKPAAIAFALAAALGTQLSAQSQSPPDDTAAWAPHRSTRVLYAGWAGGARERAFVDFLSQWFDAVDLLPLEKLDETTARDHDVVIADWCSQYGNDGYAKRENSLFSPSVTLSEHFTKPVIAIDYVSSSLWQRGKLDWL